MIFMHQSIWSAVLTGSSEPRPWPPRIFLTEDGDFGQLVYAAAKPTRFPSNARANLPTMVSDFVAEHGEKLAARFVVVQPGRIRFGLAPRD
jgi:hypothetical protein